MNNLQQEYLVNEVYTAAPQKLQLMLVEAAIRSIHRAKILWAAGVDTDAGEAILRAQEIVTQLITGTCTDEPTELARRMRSIYTFIFRTLVSAHVQRSEDKLNEASRILEIERETWQQVCANLAEAPLMPIVMSDGLPVGGMSFQA